MATDSAAERGSVSEPLSDNATYNADVEQRLVELTCRHLALLTLPLYSDWEGTQMLCEVCSDYRTIVRTEETR